MIIDPVKRELIMNAFATIADNMIISVVRTSRSVVVKHNMDFSSAVCDGNGEMVAQGLALPAHLGAIMPALRGCLDEFADDIVPGDILVTNDPYAGASHLNDVFMFKPVFANGERIAFMCLILHHTDMGGRVPGGNATDSTEIFQEGLRIPPCKIHEGGRPNRTLFRILQANVRVSDRVVGDFRAQVASLNVAEAEMLKLLEIYAVDELQAYMRDLIDYAEQRTRRAIAALPDGEAEFTDWLDDDGTGAGPVKIHVRLTKRGDEIVADFTGTSPQTSGAINPNKWYTVSNTYAVLRTVMDPDIPNNAGFYRPITVIAPEGSFVNPVFPAPVGARGMGGIRVRSTVQGALARLVPGRVPACTGGSELGVVIAGYHADRSPFLLLEFHNVTGQGGGPDRDGQDGGPSCLGNIANVPIEILEAENPVIFEEYAFLPDTEGAGKYRGGLGIVRQYRLLAEQALLQVRSDRQTHLPWGLFGGGPGGRGHTILNPDTAKEKVAPSKFVMTIGKDDVFRCEMPGSGGYGDPLQRDPSRLAEEARQGKISIDRAREVYGVVFKTGTLDVDQRRTRALRRDVEGAR